MKLANNVSAYSACHRAMTPKPRRPSSAAAVSGDALRIGIAGRSFCRTPRPVAREHRAAEGVPHGEQRARERRDGREIELAERRGEARVLHADFDRERAANGFVEAEQTPAP